MTDEPESNSNIPILDDENEKWQQEFRDYILKQPLHPRTKKMVVEIIPMKDRHNPYLENPPVEKIFKTADKTQTKRTTWVIKDWIPEGVVTALIGNPNVGKNIVIVTIAAAVSRGKEYPLWTGAHLGGYGNTIISSREEPFDSITKPKYIAAGGDTRLFAEFFGVPALHETKMDYMRASCKTPGHKIPD